jgi:oxygen-independent coproporphyrinogen-3 oxidase
MYLWSMERLETAGFRQYEISNVARVGLASRHNLKYWQDGEWMGFGCGAHSTIGSARWKNVSSTEDYVTRIGRGESVAVDRRELARDTQLEEALFTGLRLSDGLDLARIGARYEVDVWARYGSALQPFLDAGLVVHAPPKLRLSREGMLLANEILAVFV